MWLLMDERKLRLYRFLLKMGKSREDIPEEYIGKLRRCKIWQQYPVTDKSINGYLLEDRTDRRG